MSSAPKTIERRAAVNVLLGALSFLVTLGQTVLLVPILLRHWGSESYGLWLALMATFTLLQTLDLGHQNYVGNQLNVEYHSDPREFRRTLASALLVAYFLGAIELALCVLLVATGTVDALVGAPVAAVVRHDLSLALVLLMLMWAAFGSAGGLIVRILIPSGRLHESQGLGIVVRLAQFAVVVAVAVRGGGILDVAFWYAVTQSVMSLLVLWRVRTVLPALFPWWRGGEWRAGWATLRKSLLLTVNSVAQQLSSSGLVIIVGALFAAATVPSLTTLRTLTNAGMAGTAIIVTAVLPELIRFHATNESEKLAKTIKTSWFVSGVLVNGGILLVLPVIEAVYTRWTRGLLDFDEKLFFLLAASVSLANFGAVLNGYLAGINDLRAQLAVTFARATVILAATVSLSDRYGLLSVGIGAVLGEVLSSVVLPLLFVRHRLALRSTTLSTQQVVLGLAPALLLGAGGLLAITVGIPLGGITLALAPVVSFVYLLTWRRLEPDVQERMWLVVHSVAGRAGALHGRVRTGH